MRAIAAYIMRGRMQAIIATSGLGIFALLLMPLSWPLSYLSAAAVGLVTLVQGPKEGLLNVAGAMLFVAVMMGMATGQPLVAGGFSISMWLPAFLLAWVLYLSRSFALVLIINAVLGWGLITVVYLLLPDPAGWWYGYFTEQVVPAMKQVGMEIPDEAAFTETLKHSSRLMTGVLVAFISLGVAISLVIARWWQALLFRPGAFGEEFRRLRLGKPISAIGIVLVLLSTMVSGQLQEWSLNLLLVGIVLFMFQGLAVGHAWAKQRAANQAWLVAMYVIIVFTIPYGGMFAAVIGLLDNGMDFRARFRNTTG